MDEESKEALGVMIDDLANDLYNTWRRWLMRTMPKEFYPPWGHASAQVKKQWIAYASNAYSHLVAQKVAFDG